MRPLAVGVDPLCTREHNTESLRAGRRDISWAEDGGGRRRRRRRRKGRRGGGRGVSRRGGGSSSEAAVSDPTLGRGWRWALPLSHSWEPTKISGSEVSWYLKEGEDGDICGEVKVKFPLRRAIYSRGTNYKKVGKNWLQIEKSEQFLLLFRMPWWGGCGYVKVKPTGVD